jgi:hypothetical protein
MIRKIGVIILVSGILITGIISMGKLNFLGKSAAILKVNTYGQSIAGRDGSGRHSEFPEQFGHENSRISSDSAMAGFGGRERHFERQGFNRYDSLNTQRFSQDSTFSARSSFGGRMRDNDGPEGRDFRRGSIIRLDKVICYMAIFAFFTVIAIYLEKLYCLVFCRQK